jgi:serine/threonine-protein kinase
MLGKLLQGRYQVVQVLSEGGSCQTYIAQDTQRLNHPTCFVKHLKPTSNLPSSVQSLRWLFAREAEALQKLGNHDQVPQLLARFEENQEFFLVQEFIKGHRLSAELLPDHCWSESEVVQLLQDVLGILEFVHSHGLIHRDLNPSNLIRRQQDGRLVLINFGSVKQAWTQVITAQGQTSTTVSISIPATIAIGTPGYMPVEQGRGRPRLNSDIYALGMIGIQALSGLNPTQLLEDSNTGEIIWQHQVQVSAGLAAVLNKMVRYHFKDRYQSATEALQALQQLANFHPPTQPSASGQPSTQPEPPTESSVSAKTPDESIVQVMELTPSRRSLPTYLLLLLGLGIAMGLAAVIGVLYAYIQLNDIRTLKTQAKYQECITKAELESWAAKTVFYQDTQGLLNQCRLEDAKKLAASQKFADAIKTAKKIPKNSTLYPEAHKLINEWLEI